MRPRARPHDGNYGGQDAAAVTPVSSPGLGAAAAPTDVTPPGQNRSELHRWRALCPLIHARRTRLCHTKHRPLQTWRRAGTHRRSTAPAATARPRTKGLVSRRLPGAQPPPTLAMTAATAFAAPFLLSAPPSLLNPPTPPPRVPQRSRPPPRRLAPFRAQLSNPTTPAAGGKPAAAADAPLWARAPVPVYSVCTASSEVGRGNLNIATYVTPCGLGAAPKFAVALYVGTLTWVNVKQTGRARLALLAEKHLPLVALFGGTSGRAVDKCAEAVAMGFDVAYTEGGVPFLADGPGFVDVVVDSWVDCGDHELAICATVSSTELGAAGAAGAVLTTALLREQGVMDAI
jgi:flavin reductase (DIM6/NTAB) family NADH-FMN oxidoreductase RutF